MTRRVFTLFSALSLALCLAIGVLWVRSYFVTDMFRRDSRINSAEAKSCTLDFRILMSYRGKLEFSIFHWFSQGPDADLTADLLSDWRLTKQWAWVCRKPEPERPPIGEHWLISRLGFGYDKTHEAFDQSRSDSEKIIETTDSAALTVPH